MSLELSKIMHIKVLQDLQMLRYNKNNGDKTWYYFFKPEYVLLVTRLGFFDITTWNIWDLTTSHSKHTCNPSPLKKKDKKNPKLVLLFYQFKFFILDHFLQIKWLIPKGIDTVFGNVRSKMYRIEHGQKVLFWILWH